MRSPPVRARVRDLGPLEESLDYRFQDRSWLELALTHKSYANEHPQERAEDNARLEFLGDAVIELAVRRHLFEARVPIPRGRMSIDADGIVSNKNIAKVAEGLGMVKWLDVGEGDAVDKLRENPDLQADAVEAIVGAVSRDRDVESAMRVAIGLFERYAPAQLSSP